MENETEVKSFKVRQYCDKCGEELIFTGEVLLSNPEKYIHKCEKCGNVEWFPRSYPCIEYKEIKNNPCGIEFGDDFKNTLKRVWGIHSNNQNQEENKPEEIVFTLNTNEVNEYYKFIDEHKKCESSTTIGGKISIIITPTGLGNTKVVKCNACGKEKEITDISNW